MCVRQSSGVQEENIKTSVVHEVLIYTRKLVYVNKYTYNTCMLKNLTNRGVQSKTFGDHWPRPLNIDSLLYLNQSLKTSASGSSRQGLAGPLGPINAFRALPRAHARDSWGKHTLGRVTQLAGALLQCSLAIANYQYWSTVS